MPFTPLRSLISFFEAGETAPSTQMEGSPSTLTTHLIDTFAWYIFVIRAIDAVLPIFDIIRRFSPTRGV